MPRSAVIPTDRPTQATPTLYNNLVQDSHRIIQVAGAGLEISGGQITVSPGAGEGHYSVDCEALAATDDLETINGGQAGDVISLYAASNERLVTLLSGVGNIILKDGVGIILDPVEAITLRHDGESWKPLGSASSGSSVLANKSGALVAAGDVLIFDPDNNLAFKTTAYLRDLRVCGVARSAIPDGISGPVDTMAGKIVTVNCTEDTVARGQFLVSSANPGKARGVSYFREPGAFAIAMTAKGAGSGSVEAMLLDGFRQAISGTSGWNMGGRSGSTAQTLTEKFSIPTETWAGVASAALPAGRNMNNGMGYGTVAAYATHGSSNDTSASSQANRYKLNYANETLAAITASSIARSILRGGVNFSDRGWAAGGANTSGNSVDTTQKTAFATDTESAGGVLTGPRRGQGGVSDGVNCFVGGGTSTVTNLLSASTEVFSASPNAALADTDTGYSFLSFPATAGFRCYSDGSSKVYSRRLAFATGMDANNASAPIGVIDNSAQASDGVGFGYAASPTASSKLDAATGTYASISARPTYSHGANASYGAF